MKFKVGDRVKCIKQHDGNRRIAGQIGTVVGTNSCAIHVKFDNNIGGHDLNGRCSYGYGWTVREHCLESFDTLMPAIWEGFKRRQVKIVVNGNTIKLYKMRQGDMKLLLIYNKEFDICKEEYTEDKKELEYIDMFKSIIKEWSEKQCQTSNEETE